MNYKLVGIVIRFQLLATLERCAGGHLKVLVTLGDSGYTTPLALEIEATEIPGHAKKMGRLRRHNFQPLAQRLHRLIQHINLGHMPKINHLVHVLRRGVKPACQLAWCHMLRQHLVEQ